MAKKRRSRSRASTEDRVQTIDAWSYSRLSTYEACPRKAQFLYVQKLPQGASKAMERGSRIHKQAELFINGKEELPDTNIWDSQWKYWLDEIREDGYVAEMDMAFTKKWDACDYFGPTTWVRMRVDAYGKPAKLSEAALAEDPKVQNADVEVIDFKTGQPYPTHAEQGELYAIAGFLRNGPKTKVVMVSFWYLDTEKRHDTRYYTVDEVKSFMDKWTERANVMLTDTEFIPNGCKASCGKFSGCEFASNTGGQCEYTTAGVLKAGAQAGQKAKPPKAKPSKWNGGR